MRRRTAHALGWLGLVALLVLVARWLCYALAPPTLLSTRLQASAGGPRLVVVTLVSLGLAALVSTATVSIAALGVRERQRLRPERVPPRLRVGRFAASALFLFVASSFTFAMFESYLHWRAGIGFHGLKCLVGPVHRNAIPLLAALALAAAALVEAGAHVLAWMRAVVRELRRRRLTGVFPLYAPPWRFLPVARTAVVRARPRAPPLPA
ncbi:MAG TPA: hypothetical protein VLU96_11130 [Gaiellaceae bacterium]|nr:hypothetical protein [Gaiellaceae bacterium]